MLGKVVGRVWAGRQLPGLDGPRLPLVPGIDADWCEVAVDLVDAAAVALVENRDAER
jgi:microcompartment protein CcmK/EutM